MREQLENRPPASALGQQAREPVQAAGSEHQRGFGAPLPEPPKKPQGVCVLKPPGGVSTIDLGWDAEVQPPINERRNLLRNGAPRCRQGEAQPSAAGMQTRNSPPKITRSQSASRQAPFAIQNDAQSFPPPQQQSFHPQQQSFPPQQNIHHVSSSPYGWDESALPPRDNGAAQARSPHPFIHSVEENKAHGARQNPESGNRFAQGSSQNTGNVLTDRSTTRVVAPPGGFSSFCLG